MRDWPASRTGRCSFARRVMWPVPLFMQTSPIIQPPQSRGKTITNNIHRYSSVFRLISRTILSQVVRTCDERPVTQDLRNHRRTLSRSRILSLSRNLTRVGSTPTTRGGRKVKLGLASPRCCQPRKMPIDEKRAMRAYCVHAWTNMWFPTRIRRFPRIGQLTFTRTQKLFPCSRTRGCESIERHETKRCSLSER